MRTNSRALTFKIKQQALSTSTRANASDCHLVLDKWKEAFSTMALVIPLPKAVKRKPVMENRFASNGEYQGIGEPTARSLAHTTLKGRQAKRMWTCARLVRGMWSFLPRILQVSVHQDILLWSLYLGVHCQARFRPLFSGDFGCLDRSDRSWTIQMRQSTGRASAPYRSHCSRLPAHVRHKSKITHDWLYQEMVTINPKIAETNV